jgi:hypothetical protein
MGVWHDGVTGALGGSTRLTLEAEKSVIEGKLVAIDAPTTVGLDPNLTALYRSQVERLEEALGAPRHASRPPR